MKQAKVLTDNELKRLLAVVEAGKHPARNRLAVMLSFYGGMRVGEIAALIADIYETDGAPRNRSEGRLHEGQCRPDGVRRKQVAAGAGPLSGAHRSGVVRPPLPCCRPKSTRRSQRTPFASCSGSFIDRPGWQEHRPTAAGGRWHEKLAHSGVSAKVIMTLAGHKHLSTTQRYIDVNDETMRKAVEVV